MTMPSYSKMPSVQVELYESKDVIIGRKGSDVLKCRIFFSDGQTLEVDPYGELFQDDDGVPMHQECKLTSADAIDIWYSIVDQLAAQGIKATIEY